MPFALSHATPLHCSLHRTWRWSGATFSISIPSTLPPEARMPLCRCCGVSFAAARRPTNVFSQGTRNLIAALKAAGVRRLIVQSSFGVGDSRRDAGLLERVFYALLLRGAYADKVLQEQAVRESGLDYTIVRPTRLTTAAGTGRYTARVGPGPVPSSIARADVARFILDALATSEYVGKTVSLGAPG